jgi:dihydrodipicolinate synthase/N-acetylneuraminate lyase
MKALMNCLGLAAGPLRPPLVDLNPEELGELRGKPALVARVTACRFTLTLKF